METADFSQPQAPLSPSSWRQGKGQERGFPSTHAKQEASKQILQLMSTDQKLLGKPRLLLHVRTTLPLAPPCREGWRGQGFHDISSLEFAGERPTASAWYDARAVSQMLRDPPAAEGKPARHTSSREETASAGC